MQEKYTNTLCAGLHTIALTHDPAAKVERSRAVLAALYATCKHRMNNALNASSDM